MVIYSVRFQLRRERSQLRSVARVIIRQEAFGSAPSPARQRAIKGMIFKRETEKGNPGASGRSFGGRRFAARAAVAACLLLAGLAAYWSSPFGNLLLADEVTDRIRQDIDAIQQRIKDANIRLDGTIAERVTLQEVLDDLDLEIGRMQAVIAETRAEIGRLQAEIDRLRVEREAQKTILERILVLLYQRSGVSSLELIITADSFSDYLNQQEYLDRLKQGVTDSVEQIQLLSARLEEADQAALLEDQQAQEIALQAVRWEQQNLLAETLNQESLFQQQLAQLQAEHEQLERDLENYLASLLTTRNSLGSVNAGDIIGKNGNTGWSTGPHLHIAIYSHSNDRYDPLDFIRRHNLIWPMGGSGGWVSQGFHAGHRALDIAAAEGTPIRSVAAGEIIHRGCLIFPTPKFNNFAVIVDHGDYVSLYVHLQAPDNPKYGDCNFNRRNSLGVKSIDYGTTE